jgi:hypothetical protein
VTRFVGDIILILVRIWNSTVDFNRLFLLADGKRVNNCAKGRLRTCGIMVG